MAWAQRWRADLALTEAPTPRAELVPLVVGAFLVVTVAQWTDPGSSGELAVVGIAVVAYGLRALVADLPSEAFAGLVIGPVTVVVVSSGHLETSLFLVVTAVLYSAWHLGSTTRVVLIAAAGGALPWAAAATFGDDYGITWPIWALACGFTAVLGRLVNRQQRLIAELESVRLALAHQAVADERRRIARELHDLAGHTLAAVLLHVTGARHVLRRDLDEAERALVDAETIGRSSLDQIRAAVEALRTDERGTDAALAGTGDIAAVVEEYRRAGLKIHLTSLAPDTHLDGPVATALHRIAREALANVARHAAANTVEVEVRVADATAVLVVADHGTRGRPAPHGAGHFGLTGMGERARALGGDLVAEPTPDGWRVQARLPLAPSVEGRPSCGQSVVPS